MKMKNSQLQVKDLIAMLEKVNPEAVVTIWMDGEAHQLHAADTLDVSDCGLDVQINAFNTDAYINDSCEVQREG
jgi:hypothetical protein